MSAQSIEVVDMLAGQIEEVILEERRELADDEAMRLLDTQLGG